MATLVETTKIGPSDHGRRMMLDEFVEAETVGAGSMNWPGGSSS